MSLQTMRPDPVILITGKDGQVGRELVRAIRTQGRIVAVGREELDLGDAGAIKRLVREVAPRTIFNAAAYTAVDRAESEPEEAMRINAAAPGILAQEARELGALLVHYSTDYVFDGTKQGAYSEMDRTAPVNVYGKTKLAGERAVSEAGGDHLILRTSWVYGGHGQNFLLTMLRLMNERENLQIVDDQTGAPTWARTIAEISAMFAERSHLSGRFRNNSAFVSGTYHLSSRGWTSWCGFARQIAKACRRLHPDDPLLIKNIDPTGTENYPTPAARPKNSRLSVEKLERTLDIELPEWHADLDKCLAGIEISRQARSSG